MDIPEDDDYKALEENPPIPVDSQLFPDGDGDGLDDVAVRQLEIDSLDF
jgi:hypothetical protein